MVLDLQIAIYICNTRSCIRGLGERSIDADYVDGYVNRRGGANYSAGDQFEIIANHINTLNDIFTFTAPAAAVYNIETAKADVEKINVFPNPYYGINARETSRLNKYVTFNHLPQKATIRIFNLAGILVNTIPKDNASQLATWNLRNHNSLPVASGIYIVHVDMPDLGKTKILKLAIIQEEQILPTY